MNDAVIQEIGAPSAAVAMSAEVPSDPPAPPVTFLTERQRALRAALVGAILGLVLAGLAGRR